MIIPVGARGRQELLEITRHGQRFEERVIGQVVFVPLLTGVT